MGLCAAFLTSGGVRLKQGQKACYDRRTCRRKWQWSCSTRGDDKAYVVHDDGDDVDSFVTPVSTSEELGPDRPFLENCPTCENSGFVQCSACDGQGVIQNKRSVNVFYCPDCVGHKKVRCPACGGKCYMCHPTHGITKPPPPPASQSESHANVNTDANAEAKMNKEQNNSSNVEHTLNAFEDDLIILEDALRASSRRQSEPLTSSFSANLYSRLKTLPSKLQSRDDAERLLSIGISFWNAINSSEGRSWGQSTHRVLTRTRHIAVDCMHLAHVTLNGVSERFQINEVLLMKFYVSCGRKYSSRCDDHESALTCYEAAESLIPRIDQFNIDQPASLPINASRTMFELYLGKASSLWVIDDSDDNNDGESASNKVCEDLVSQAKTFLEVLPAEYEHIASIEYNFGLHAYERKDIDRAVRWLNRSIATRELYSGKDSIDGKKQATSMRLIGVCFLALQKFEQSWKMLRKAESLHSDPTTVYLLLKLSIITKKKSSASELLRETVDNPQIGLTDCVGCVSLFVDANLLHDAIVAYRTLFQRFKQDVNGIVGVIGPKLFETAVSLGDLNEAVNVLQVVCDLISKHSEQKQYLKWSTMCLAAGCNHSDNNEYYSAAIFLERALLLGGRLRTEHENKKKKTRNNNGGGVEANTAKNTLTVRQGEVNRHVNILTNNVLEHESMVCRLLSCNALRYLEQVAKRAKGRTDEMTASHCDRNKLDGVDGDSESDGDKEKREKMTQLAIKYAEDALRLDETDFTVRLVLFRAHIMAGDFDKAALDLRDANKDLDSFDVSALIEAACVARDYGYPQSVVTVLKCIITQGEVELKGYSKGLYGTILVSCVGIMMNEIESLMQAYEVDDDGTTSSDTTTEQKLLSLRHDLIELYNAGVRGVQMLGMEDAFGENDGDDVENDNDKLRYLCDVAWNEGRRLNDKDHDLIIGFFNVCHSFCQFRTVSNETLRMRLVSKVICASAAIEGDRPDYKEGYVHLRTARQELDTLREMRSNEGGGEHSNSTGSGINNENEMQNVMIMLEARCHAGSHDIDAFERTLVECSISGGYTSHPSESMTAGFAVNGDDNDALSSSRGHKLLTSGITVESVKQLAGICYSWHSDLQVISTDRTTTRDVDGGGTGAGAAEQVKLHRLRLARLQIGLLEHAVRMHVTGNEYSSDAVATMRELIEVHLRLNEASEAGFVAFKRAVSYAKEHARDVDRDERQWLMSLGWERGQTLMQLGRRREGTRWARATMDILNKNGDEEDEHFNSIFINLINGDGDETH